jgi:hypothetical protein
MFHGWVKKEIYTKVFFFVCVVLNISGATILKLHLEK